MFSKMTAAAEMSTYLSVTRQKRIADTAVLFYRFRCIRINGNKKDDNSVGVYCTDNTKQFKG